MSTGDTPDREQIDRVADLLAVARSALFVTGAGLSADSGLPTYRGIGGLYEREVVEEGMAIEEALSGHTMRRAPELCWKYIHQVEQACRGARPNRGHEVMAWLEERLDRVWDGSNVSELDTWDRQLSNTEFAMTSFDDGMAYAVACTDDVGDHTVLRFEEGANGWELTEYVTSDGALQSSMIAARRFGVTVLAENGSGAPTPAGYVLPAFSDAKSTTHERCF